MYSPCVTQKAGCSISIGIVQFVTALKLKTQPLWFCWYRNAEINRRWGWMTYQSGWKKNSTRLFNRWRMCDNGKNVYVPEPCATAVSRNRHFEIDVESQYNNALCYVLTDPVTTAMAGPQYVYKNRFCVPALQTHCVGDDALIPWEFTFDYMVALDETGKPRLEAIPLGLLQRMPTMCSLGKELSYTLLLLQAMHFWKKPFSCIFLQRLTRLYSPQLITSDIGFEGFQNKNVNYLIVYPKNSAHGCHHLYFIKIILESVTRGPLLTWFNFNLSMDIDKKNHMSNKMWNEITHPFPNGSSFRMVT